MKKLISVVLAIFISAILGSCSTFINTTTQSVEIKSIPPNAKVVVDGKKFGTTPQIVNIERKKNHTLKIELEGYEPYESQITTKLSSWFWCNILNGFIPGGIIDMFTGSMYKLLPETLNVQLQQLKQSETVSKRK
jgi:hypothetical protein